MSQHKSVVLITGTSSGFGRDTAHLLAKNGHTVYASMRSVDGRNKDKADALRAFADEHGVSIRVIELDVTDTQQVERAVEHVIDDAGRLDAVVNNAGYGAIGVLESISPEQERQMFEVNVHGPTTLARAVLPQMRAQKRGLIVNISSGLGRFTMPGFGVYASTKWALEALTESLRYETAALGIDAVLIEPGAFKTDFFGNMPEPALQERVGDYGDLANLEQAFEAGMDQYFASEHYRPAGIVAEAIVDVIESEPGSRPARVPVGADMQPVIDLNERAADTQRALLAGFGFEQFAPLA
ncbi:MAG: SDR family oxidoreductase [Planctomycetota bacterium]